MTVPIRSHEGATPAIPAIPATPATPASQDEHPALRATPATRATPAVPPEVEVEEEEEVQDTDEQDEQAQAVEEEEDANAQEEAVKVSKRRNGMRRAEQSDHVNFGEITSEQWHLVNDFKKGQITEDALRTQFLALYKSKLDIMVEQGKISAEEENRRIARFTTLIDKIITNFSS